MKLKARSGVLFEFSHVFKNDNYVELRCDLYDFGIGIDFAVGDSRRYFELDFLFLHLLIWF